MKNGQGAGPRNPLSRSRKSTLGVIWLLCSQLWVVAAPEGPAKEGPPPTGSWVELQVLMARRAALYERAALGFSCEETIRRGRFGAKSGENEKEVEERFDYLYEGNPAKGYAEVRMERARRGETGKSKEVELDLGLPEAYGWALLFTDWHRSHFRFDWAGEERLGFRLAARIDFAGSKPHHHGREIEEWSGRAWIDLETGNILKILATPHNQEDRLRRENLEWSRGLRLGSVLLKRRPRGKRYEILFTVEKFGLTFPGEAELRTFHLDHLGEEELRERVAQRFRNYLFFNVASDEEFLEEDEPDRRERSSEEREASEPDY